MNIEQNTITHFLLQAEKFPDQIAVSDKVDVTYARLKQAVINRAAYLRKKGIHKGDRVLVLIPMSVQLYVNVLALFYIGATIIFIDEWVSKERLNVCCRIAKCKAFIAPRRLHMVAFFFKEIGKIPIWLHPNGKEKSANIPVENCNENDAALITFTTGSTGTPKAAIRTHGILNAQFAALSKKTGLSTKDKVMTTLPIVLLIGLGNGSTMVMASFKPAKPWRLDSSKVIRQIHQSKINVVIASPYFIDRLSSVPHTNTAVKKIYTGGAPVFPDMAQRITRSFPGADVQVVFGSTEAEPISMVNALDVINRNEELIEKGLFAGKIDEHTQLAIISIVNEPLGEITETRWKEIQLPYGKTGEIVVKGNHVVREYLDNEEAFRENKIVVHGNIWHRTGDMGWVDTENNLWLQGRCKQRISNNGSWISPFIYEGQLQAINGVVLGTVLQTEKKILLVIETKPGVDENVIRTEIERKHLVCNEIKFVTKIPRDPRHFSKIDYAALTKQI